MSRRGANKKTMTMTPIIELKRHSSRLKHYITLFLNILLVDCYVGKLLWCNHMVCIWRCPTSNLIVFIFHHHPDHSTFWLFPRKVAWGFELLKTRIMFEGSKTGRPASDTIFSRQLTSATWKMSCLQHFLCVSSWYQFGERRLFPKLVPGWNT
jgi:hypothetical protein